MPDKTQPDMDELENDLIKVINYHINTQRLNPQHAALVLAGMIPEILEHLAWQPQAVRAAIVSAHETKRHLSH